MKHSVILIIIFLLSTQSGYGSELFGLVYYFDVGYESGGSELAKIEDSQLVSDSNAGGGTRLTFGGQIVMSDRHRFTLGVGMITEHLDDLRYRTGGFDSKTVTATYDF